METEKPKYSRTEKNGYSKKKRALRILGNIGLLLLMAVSLLMIFNKPVRNVVITKTAEQYQLSNIKDDDIKKNIEQVQAKEVEAETNPDQAENLNQAFDFSQVQPLSSETIFQDQIARTFQQAQRLPVIGGIVIPDLGINLPIFYGVENIALMYGAGTMKPGQQMGQGNYALASHHTFGFNGASSLLFSPLDYAKPGQMIYISDKSNIYSYQITDVSVVNPEDSYVIQDTEGKNEITLVTCTDLEATQRIIVKGELMGSEPYEVSTIKSQFEQRYNQ